LRHYVHGGYYLHRGYPISKKGRDSEMTHTTITVLPRAEQFFEAVGFKDGTLLSKNIFYSLLLDGDISSPSIERNRPTIHDIPYNIFLLSEGLGQDDNTISLLKEHFSKARYLIEFYRTLKTFAPRAETSCPASFS
jgi:hypothetical protein